MSDPFKPVLSKPSLVGRNPKVRMFPIGSNAAKDEVYSSFRVTKPGPGYCHFPNLPHYDDDHWKQLCSEKMVPHTRGGRTYRTYHPVGPNVRNEALDNRCYALVARMILNPNLEAMAKRRLIHSEVADREPDTDANNVPTTDPPHPTPPPATPEARRRRFRVIDSSRNGRGHQ